MGKGEEERGCTYTHSGTYMRWSVHTKWYVHMYVHTYVHTFTHCGRYVHSGTYVHMYVHTYCRTGKSGEREQLMKIVAGSHPKRASEQTDLVMRG